MRALRRESHRTRGSILQAQYRSWHNPAPIQQMAKAMKALVRLHLIAEVFLLRMCYPERSQINDFTAYKPKQTSLFPQI